MLQRYNVIQICWLVGFFIFTQLGFADSQKIVQTKTKLQQVEQKIQQLKQTLSHSEDKRGTLNQELASTEKQIGGCIEKLHDIQRNIVVKQTNIATLQQGVKRLNEQLQQQQSLLSQHVKARYKMGEYRPILIALNQDDPHKTNRLLTFYQYLVQSRQRVIDNIMETQQALTADQAKLEAEIQAQQQFQNDLSNQRQKFEQSKHYHEVVIQTLSQEIQTQQAQLSEFEQDKANLARLLQKLALESQYVAPPKKPFITMRHQLPYPVKVNARAAVPMNQGVTFYAAEGTAVHAVYPGKVVFSDWLKGYGMLLIIDHGQGFMTLYAHNQALFKRKGSGVAAGEQIATIGHSGGIKESGLYFEVRQSGKAVPPLAWFH